MRDPRFEYDRGDASLLEPEHTSPLSSHGPFSPWSIVGASAFCIAIAILWGIVPVDQTTRSLFAGAAHGLDPSAVPPRPAAPGFTANHAAASAPGKAQLMVLTPHGDIILASLGADILLVKADHDGDGRADGVTKLIGGLDSVRGLALEGDWLYVAEVDRVFRVRFDAMRGRVLGPQEKLADLSIDGSF